MAHGRDQESVSERERPLPATCSPRSRADGAPNRVFPSFQPLYTPACAGARVGLALARHHDAKLGAPARSRGPLPSGPLPALIPSEIRFESQRCPHDATSTGLRGARQSALLLSWAQTPRPTPKSGAKTALEDQPARPRQDNLHRPTHGWTGPPLFFDTVEGSKKRPIF